MGLPEIYISFETAAVSAVKRSSRGVAALVGGQQAAQSGYSFCHIELLLVRIGRP